MDNFAVVTLLLAPITLIAQPVGVPNFRQVSESVYRGAQPSPEGFRTLAKLGIKTVVDLRHKNSQARVEQRRVEALGMRFLSVPMTMGAPTDQQVSRVLETLGPNAGPVFVHCHGGRDRTGTVIACYRIAHDQWDSEKALDEAKSAGMRMRRDLEMEKFVRMFRPASVPSGQQADGASVTKP